MVKGIFGEDILLEECEQLNDQDQSIKMNIGDAIEHAFLKTYMRFATLWRRFIDIPRRDISRADFRVVRN